MKLYTLYDNGTQIIDAMPKRVREILAQEYQLSPSQITRLITYRGQREINGLYVSTTGEYDVDLSQQKKKNSRQARRNYSTVIYAFDIETSTYTTKDGRKLSLMYLGCIKGILCNPSGITTKNYTEYMTYKRFFRTYEELNNILVELNDKAIEHDEYVYIYVHNLSYEFSFFQNLDFVREWYSNDTMIATSGRKPISFELDHLIIRCSYKLIGKSLAVIGAELGLDKLTDIKNGYDVKYTPQSELPQSEYIYNERDVDVTLLGVLDTFKNSNYYTDVDSIKNMLTATSLTRLENQLLTDKDGIDQYTRRCTSLISFYNAMLPTGRTTYNLLRDTFMGGYVRGNRYFIFTPLADVMSYDISSSYPSQMFMSHYPIKYAIIKDHLLTRFSYYNKENSVYIDKYNGVVNWYLRKSKKTLPHYYIAKIKIANVKIKSFKNKNEMPFLSISKCECPINAGVSNGRVIKASELTISLTVFDYLIYQMFYDFDVVDVIELLHTTHSVKLDDYVTNSLNYFSKQKVVFKRLLNKDIHSIDVDDFYFNDDLIVTDNFIEYFFNLNDNEKSVTLERELRLSKNRLNAQYGINVQQLAPDELTFDIDCNLWEHTSKEYIDAFKLMRNYIVGVHITAFARFHLAVMSFMIFTETNATVIYWDTDSLKIYGDADNVKMCFSRFNEHIHKYWKCEQYYNMGLYDFEGVYDHFVTGGAKSYIFEKNGNLTVSISGVPKRTTSSHLTSIYNGDFEHFVSKYYHPNVVFCSNVTGKLASGYYKNDDNYFNKECVTDEQGENYVFTGYGGCVLLPSDFTITGTGWTDTSVAEECRTLTNLVKNGVSLRYTTIGTPSNIDDRLDIFSEV